MSRPSIIWIIFWVVIACLLIVVWQAFRIPDASPERSSSMGADRSEQDEPSGPLSQDGTDGGGPAPLDLNPKGLLQSLPAPQSPPLNLDAKAKKQWYDELIGLIDDAAYHDDNASLRMLIVEFGSPEAEISRAAFTSLQARRDKKALPYLEEMSGLSLDPAKRRQLDELIGFLKQKSVFDHLRSKE